MEGKSHIIFASASTSAVAYRILHQDVIHALPGLTSIIGAPLTDPLPEKSTFALNLNLKGTPNLFSGDLSYTNSFPIDTTLKDSPSPPPSPEAMNI